MLSRSFPSLRNHNISPCKISWLSLLGRKQIVSYTRKFSYTLRNPEAPQVGKSSCPASSRNVRLMHTQSHGADLLILTALGHRSSVVSGAGIRQIKNWKVQREGGQAGRDSRDKAEGRWTIPWSLQGAEANVQALQVVRRTLFTFWSYYTGGSSLRPSEIHSLAPDVKTMPKIIF